MRDGSDGVTVQPLRILFLITDLHRGGSPLLLADLAPRLVGRGMDVEVVSIAPEGEVAALLRQRRVPVFSLMAAGRGDASALSRFVGLLRDHRPDVVCSILVHANLLAVMAKPFVPGSIRWVQSIHTVQERPRWHWYLQGVLCSFADAFVAPSRAVIRKLQGFGNVPGAVVIPNGIDVPRFRDAVAIPGRERPWPADAFVVGYIGRFDRVKRLSVLVEAMRGMAARVHLALVGYGAEEMYLKALVKKWHLESRVHFVGATEMPERWYKTFCVFCSPSPAEGFGLTLAEAAAAGLPVIACRTEAVVETLPEAIWLPEDATAADVIRGVERSMMGAKAVEGVAERYSLGCIVERYEKLFRG